MKGSSQLIQGDVAWTFDLDAVATLEKDDRPPELRSEPSSPHGPSDALLPWDPIEVECAEPIVATVFEAKTSVLLSDVDHAGASTALPVSWTFTPTEERTRWAGIVRAAAHLSAWDHHPTQTAKPYTVQASAGIVDAAGLESQKLSTSFAILDVGASQPSFTFDATGAPAPVSWGLVGRHGIAGRVQAPTGTLAVRYRLLFAPDASTPDEPPYPYGPAFTIEIATAGHEPIAQAMDAPSHSSLLDLGAPAGEFRWATAWTTADVGLPGSVPPMVIDLGFSIGSAGSGFDWCGGGPLPLTTSACASDTEPSAEPAKERCRPMSGRRYDATQQCSLQTAGLPALEFCQPAGNGRTGTGDPRHALS